MESTLLEVARGADEEVEQLERLIVKDLQSEHWRLFQSHRVGYMIDTITAATEKHMKKRIMLRKGEIAALGGQTAGGTNVFSASYDKLEEAMLLMVTPALFLWLSGYLFLTR